ncbi:DUF4124 domain-containing protein [Kangiella geojedonensis]|uniref:DUF4124 domain-containing protein n=1 Tax=Kangiella geojedonensis TaxID=914150 RepID=A0A0F6RB58_9GAMM|nr:DUF4124 domain-containing protein [Kangiella geojedonensis]AKE51293.1 hypothetical protein TQ33_0305 [Kangiella geojedonensis]
MKLLPLTLFTLFTMAGSLLSNAANETVMYKKVDKNGKVTFTDKPIPGSTPITIKTNTNVVDTPKPTIKPKTFSTPEELDDKSQEPFKYEVLAVDSPEHDQAVRANSGDINIIVGLTPSLQPNHSLQLIMDGSPVGSQQKIPYFALNGVDRGTHQISVQVIDDESKDTVQTSESITFHLLRASRLNR